MILCDGEVCNTGWHTFCLTEFLKEDHNLVKGRMNPPVASRHNPPRC
jgi:hypothetical protein